MKTKLLKRIEISLGIFVLSGLFMNASYVPQKIEQSITFEKIDSDVRLNHAREVLGSSYKKSSKVYGATIGSKDVYRKVRDNLPKADRRYAKGLTKAVLRESRRHGFDPVFVLAIIQTESQWNRSTVGSAGEIGLMQIRPETAEWITHVTKMPWKGPESLKDPATNVKIGLAYVAYLRKHLGSNSVKYISAYNMGPTALRKLIAAKKKPETYRNKILANYELIYRGIASSVSSKL